MTDESERKWNLLGVLNLIIRVWLSIYDCFRLD